MGERIFPSKRQGMHDAVKHVMPIIDRQEAAEKNALQRKYIRTSQHQEEGFRIYDEGK